MTRHFPTLEEAMPWLCEWLQPEGASLMLSAPPGSGKTTTVPLALLQCGWSSAQRMLMLEPRRLAARAAASRMAQLLGEEVGQTVGYRVRFDAKVSQATRIEVVTEGLLVRRLQADPELAGVALVIFDELHERHLQTDLSLALCLDARAGLRPDLRIAAMSATLPSARVGALLVDAAQMSAGGAPFAVQTRYLGSDTAIRTAVNTALQDGDGDVLVFLPGAAEIRRAAETLSDLQASSGVRVCSLFGSLSAAEQDRALRPDPDGLRKVVLATNIAESSLTIDGVRTVVDSGLARVPRFDASAAMTRLATERISRDSADQRRGRAGRQAPGLCLRLWNESEHVSRAAHTPAEITYADLCPPLLQALAWGCEALSSLPLLESPSAGAEAQAKALLCELGATDAQGRITPRGRRMSELPVHPRLAAMLIGVRERCGDSAELALACRLSAIIEEGLPWRGAGARSRTDLGEAAAMLDAPGAQARDWSRAVAARIRRAEQALRSALGTRARAVRGDALQAGALLLGAFPDRVARRQGSHSFAMSNGRRAVTDPEDPLSRSDWLVVAESSGDARGARVYMGAETCERDVRAVLGGRLTLIEQVEWDPRSEAVRAERIERLGALALVREPLSDAAPDAVGEAMREGIRQMGLAVLPWTARSEQWRRRVALLRTHDAEGGWPDMRDDALLASIDEWLAPFVAACSRRSHLQRVDLGAALGSLLDWQQVRELDAAAPERVRLPSGRAAALEYHFDSPPVLSVPMQELYGAQRGPAVMRGRVPVLLHLLSPAGRPLQVTADLAGFWQGPYAEVRKEMRGRYPKHHWPEDPASAKPGVRTGKRR